MKGFDVQGRQQGKSLMRTGIYPGTFDPITLGHMDIIQRGARLFDRLIVGVAYNPDKQPLFSLEERVQQVDRELAKLRAKGLDVSAEPFSNLLMAFVVEHKGTAILRGIRAVSDYEYEFQMASMNARINPGVETVFLTASEGQHFIASRLVKEIAKLGGDVASFVSPEINQALREVYKTQEVIRFKQPGRS